MERWLFALSRCPVFKNISGPEIAEVFRGVQYAAEEFEKGAVIYRAGDESRRIGVIVSGCLEIRKYLPSGKAVSMFQRRSGDMIGGGIVLSSRPEYPCDVIARERSRILWIDRDDLLGIILKNAAVAVNVLMLSADRIMSLEKRVELFSYYSIQKKIAFSLLNDFTPDEGGVISLPFSKTTWAEYLNVSRTSLCRELKAMCARGLISAAGRNITVGDTMALEELLS